MPKLLELYLGKDLAESSNPDDFWLKSEYFNLFDEARKDFDKALIKKIMKLEYDAETLGEKYVGLKKYEKELAEKKQQLISKEHNNGYIFITINPKPDVSLADFRKAVEKAAARNIFTECQYVYEQRGAMIAEMGKGFHCHMLCKRNLNYKPSKVANNIKNTFKDITNVGNPSLLNIQIIGDEFARDKVEYITGTKTGEDKDKKQDIDVLWRQAFGIDPFYGCVQI